MEYNPINLIRNYISRKNKEKHELQRKEQRRSELHEKLEETRALLQHVAVMRCNRYRWPYHRF